MLVSQLVANDSRAGSSGSDFKKDFRSMPQITPYGVTDRQHQLVLVALSTPPVADEALVRLGNLKAVLKARGLGATDLAKMAKAAHQKGRVSYFADLIKDRKSFGEKTARRIEGLLGIPQGSLDQVDAGRVGKLQPLALAVAEEFQRIPAEHEQERDIIWDLVRSFAEGARAASLIKMLSYGQSPKAPAQGRHKAAPAASTRGTPAPAKKPTAKPPRGR